MLWKTCTRIVQVGLLALLLGASVACSDDSRTGPDDGADTISTSDAGSLGSVGPVTDAVPDARATDSAAHDFATAEAGIADAGADDSGTGDTVLADSGADDAETADSAVDDAETADFGTSDGEIADSGVADTGTADTGTADTGTADTGTVYSDIPDANLTDTAMADSDAGSAPDVGVDTGVDIGLDVDAGEPPVLIYLMAGQSNMLGSNTHLARLTAYICDVDASLGVDCGDSTIDDAELTSVFLTQVETDLASAPAGSPVTARLEDFLCEAEDPPVTLGCGDRTFDMTERLFRSVSNHYYHAGNDRFQWGYDAFKQMSTAMGLQIMVDAGTLDADLLGERDDVSVIMHLASLADDSTRSFVTTSGALALGFGAGRNNVYGPELAFGHAMGDATEAPIVLVKVVQGGTSLRVDWRSTSVEANTDNVYTEADLAIESLYPHLIDIAAALLEPGALSATFPEYEGRAVELAGFVWFQGWNDGDDLAASQYETNFRGFIGDLRTDLARPALPIVVAVSHRGEPNEPLQIAQTTVAQELDAMDYCVTDDLSNYFHYDSAAHLVIGARMAETMKGL